MGFDTVPLLIIGFCLVLVVVGSLILFRGQWLIQWLKGSAGLLLVFGAVWFALFAFNLFSYEPLARDKPLATVSFRALGEQNYIATVSTVSGLNVDYRLMGDLWQLDSRIIRWKGVFGLFGFQPGYQLDRISGRYLSLEDGLAKEHSEHQIRHSAIGVDVWESARSGWSLMLEAQSASVAFLPMADGAIYEVSMSNAGLTGRPMNESAQSAIARWE